MAGITPNAKGQEPKPQRIFAGLGWINKTPKGEFINVLVSKKDLDKVGAASISIDSSCTIQLWPNSKREGKKDADYRMSILIPQTA